MLEVAAERAAPIEVLGDRERPVLKAVEPAEQDGADAVFEAAAQVLDDLADEPAGLVEHPALHAAAEAEDDLEQIDAGLQPAERLGVGDQLGQAVAVEGVFLDDFDRLAREQLADL